MTAAGTIDPTEFVSSVKPALEARDVKGLHAILCSRWTAEQITSLLSTTDGDAAKVAALALSLVGGKCCIDALATKLRDPDPLVSQLADHALWSCWFRGGCDRANKCLADAVAFIHSMQYEQALVCCDQAIALSPEWAEGYNQRSIALYLMERYEQAIAAGRRAVERMPCHFGAWSHMGHCYAHLGQLSQALECYRKALCLNPHLTALRDTVNEIERRRRT